MSLEDLEIKKHTDPLRAELDRQKEKCARMKRERDALAVRVNTLETETVAGLCRELDELRTQRQFLFAAFRNACERYGATQGMKDYAGDVADGAFRILGVDIKVTR